MAYRILRVMTAFAAMSSVANAPDPDLSFNRAVWIDDLNKLEAELEQNYVNITWLASTQSKVNLPALDAAARLDLRNAQTAAQAKSALLKFVEGFGDGHLSEVAPIVKPAVAAVPEPADVPLSDHDAVSGCAALGYGTTATVTYSLPFETLPGFQLFSDGVAKPFRSAIVQVANRRVGLIRIAQFSSRPYPQICVEAWHAVRKKGASVTAESIDDASQEIWMRELASRVVELKRRHVDAMLVDVGSNDGGDGTGDYAARVFTGQLLKSAPLLIVRSPAAREYINEELVKINRQIERARSGESRDALVSARSFFTAAAASRGRGNCSLSWVWHERRAWNPTGCNLVNVGYAGGAVAGFKPHALSDPATEMILSRPSRYQQYFGRWTGPLSVLTYSDTYSSAEMFAAVLRDNASATLLGRPTGKDGCGWMNDEVEVGLPNSGLRFRVPSCMRLRPDQTNAQAGIIPDMEIAPAPGESRRARAARVVRLTAEKIISIRS